MTPPLSITALAAEALKRFLGTLSQTNGTIRHSTPLTAALNTTNTPAATDCRTAAFDEAKAHIS